MIYVNQMTIAPSRAKDLEQQGFILKLVAMHLDGTDTYNVFVKHNSAKAAMYSMRGEL